MDQQFSNARLSPSPPPPSSSKARRLGIKIAIAAGAALFCSVLLPVVPIFVGVFWMVAAGLHAWSEDLRPYLETLLRLPVARAGKRRARLVLIAVSGALLVIVGSVGAAMHGHVRTALDQRAERRQVADQDVSDLVERAKGYLAAGDYKSATRTLIDAGSVPGIHSEREDEIDDLLVRVHRSGDRKEILAILVELSNEEFEAFETGTAVPQALDFGERSLNRRAMELALDQVDEARAARSGR